MKLTILPLVACIFLISFDHCTSSRTSGRPSINFRHVRGSSGNNYPAYAPMDDNQNELTGLAYVPLDYTKFATEAPWDGYVMAYKFHPTKKTWNEARKTCHQERAYLAYADSEQERRRYHEILNHKNSGGAWMGMHDLFEEGDWVTVLDESVNELNLEVINWAPYEPNNYGVKGENCAELQMDGRLYDMACDKQLFFFCKMYVKY